MKPQQTQSVVRGTVLIGGAAAITAFTSFGIAVLLTRHFGPTRYGEYASLVAWASALAVLAEGGLAVVLSQQVVRNPAAEGTLLRVAMRRRVIISFLASLVAISFLSLAGQGRPSVIALAAMCLAYQLDLALEIPIAIWRSRRAYAQAAGWRVARRTIYLAATAIAVTSGADVEAVSIVALVTVGPIAVCAAVLALRATVHSRKPHARLPVAASGLYWVSGVLYWIYFQADQLMLTVLADPAELGFYAPAVATVSISLALYSVIADVLLPRLFEETSEPGGGLASIRRRTLLQVPLFAAIGAMIWGSVTLVAPEATRLVFGPRFAPTAPLLTILSAFVAMRFLSFPAVLALVALDRMAALVAVQAVAAAINIAGNALLIGHMGAKGSALATLLSEGVLLISTWALLPADWRRSAAQIAAPHVLMGGCLATARLAVPGRMNVAFLLIALFLGAEATLLSRQIPAARAAR